MQLNPQEKQILRDLASRYMEIASLPVQAEKRDLWKALNRSKMEGQWSSSTSSPGMS